MVALQNLVSLAEMVEEKKLQETLQTNLTNTDLYVGDYERFKKYCEEFGQLVSGDMLVYYLHHSLKEQRVKKNTFNRRYFACKKMMELEGVHLTEEQMNMVKRLRKHFRTDEHAKQAQVKGKGAVNSQDLLATIHQMENPRAKAILLVQFYTACRPSEMVLLKLSDFDLDNGSVNVYLKKQKQYAEKRLPLLCVNAIKSYIKAYKLTDDAYLIGTVDKHGNYRSKQISLSGYNQFLNKVIHLSAYNFRKSLVSHMHNKGAGVEIIQKQTGHTSTKTLTEHYLKVDKTMVDQFL